jgi:hypothetical protein
MLHEVRWKGPFWFGRWLVGEKREVGGGVEVQCQVRHLRKSSDRAFNVPRPRLASLRKRATNEPRRLGHDEESDTATMDQSANKNR